MMRRRLLVTGAAGALGHAVTQGLRERGHVVRGFDLRSSSDGEHHVGDILDVDALREAVRGVDTIVHLAGVPERDSFVKQLVPNNIVGTHNVFEAARMEGVGKVVYASSCRVVGGLDWSRSAPQIGLDAGLVPGDHYGLTKASCELMAKMYSDRFGMSVVCARLGWFVRNLGEAEYVEKVESGRRIYVSHRDAVRFFELAVTADDVRFAAVFVVSRNDDNPLFDPEPARELFGFIPLDSWPQGSSWSEELHFPSPRHAPSLLPDR